MKVTPLVPWKTPINYRSSRQVASSLSLSLSFFLDQPNCNFAKEKKSLREKEREDLELRLWIIKNQYQNNECNEKEHLNAWNFSSSDDREPNTQGITKFNLCFP